MAPRGHGYLLTNGYVGDASVYFCPTMSTPGPTLWDIGSGWRCPNPLNSLSDLKRIGGTTAKDWTYGSYDKLYGVSVPWYKYVTDSYNSVNYSAMRWVSSYNYRCQPMACTGSQAGGRRGATPGPARGPASGVDGRRPRTSPRLPAEPAGATAATGRRWRARALAGTGGRPPRATDVPPSGEA